jgi:hypothetical protein
VARTESGLCRDNKPEWQAWNNARHRCLSTNNPFYPKYGGQGITICNEWADDFAAFLTDMGKRPSSKHELGRLDSKQGYSKANCAWMTRQEIMLRQPPRTKPNQPNRPPITYKGVTRSLREWAKHLGIGETALGHRLSTYGWTLDEALGGQPRSVSRGYPKKHYVEWKGETRHVSEWAEQAGISRGCLIGRIYRLGWTMDRAMTEPKGQYHRKEKPEKSPDDQ